MTTGRSDPTLVGVGDAAQARQSRWWRRVGVGTLLLLVILSLTGWLGPRESTVTDGDLTVTFPHVTRPGVESTLEVSADGLGPGRVAVEVPSTVMDRLGIETISPRPVSETSMGDVVRLTFDGSGAGGVFTVRFFGRVPVRAQLGTLTYSIRVGSALSGRQQVSARMWVLP